MQMWKCVPIADGSGVGIRGAVGDDGDRYAPDLDEIAWCGGNSGNRTHPVDGNAPNPFGLDNMIGNVDELVQDRWSISHPGGGWWEGSESSCRASTRSAAAQDDRAFLVDFGDEVRRVGAGFGFRILRTVP